MGLRSKKRLPRGGDMRPGYSKKERLSPAIMNPQEAANEDGLYQGSVPGSVGCGKSREVG